MKNNNGIKVEGKIIIFNGCWYGRKTKYNKEHYYKSYNCRFDNTCGGTKEITAEEFYNVAEKYAKIFS